MSDFRAAHKLLYLLGLRQSARIAAGLFNRLGTLVAFPFILDVKINWHLGARNGAENRPEMEPFLVFRHSYLRELVANAADAGP